MICPLTVIKCQRSDFTGRVNEISHAAVEVRGIRTISCGLRFKKRPETDNGPAAWWVVPELPAAFASMPGEEGLRLFGFNEEQIAGILGLVRKAKEWDLQPDVEKTSDNPNGNPPVTCEHCKKAVRWPDREGCEGCGGFTHLDCETRCDELCSERSGEPSDYLCGRRARHKGLHCVRIGLNTVEWGFGE